MPVPILRELVFKKKRIQVGSVSGTLIGIYLLVCSAIGTYRKSIKPLGGECGSLPREGD